MKLRSFTRFTLLIGLMIMALGAGSARANPTLRQITINGMRLHPKQIQDVNRLLGYPLPSGRYWHDARTGLWGRMGGPPLGLMPGGYIQQTRATVHAHGNGNRVTTQPSPTLRISAMIDLSVNGSGQDTNFNNSH